MASKVVGVGNTSGRSVDKFEMFQLYCYRPEALIFKGEIEDHWSAKDVDEKPNVQADNKITKGRFSISLTFYKLASFPKMDFML